MADPSEVARIRAYLEQHKYTYDRRALHEKLCADGYDPAAIDAAMVQVYSSKADTPASPTRFRAGQALGGLGLYGLLNVVLYFVLMMTIAARIGPGTTFVMPLVFALLIGGIAFVLWGWQRSLAIGVLAGYALMSLLSGGTCTFFNIEGSDRGLLMGMFYYPLMLIVLLIGFGIYQLYTSLRRR